MSNIADESGLSRSLIAADATDPADAPYEARMQRRCDPEGLSRHNIVHA